MKVCIAGGSSTFNIFFHSTSTPTNVMFTASTFYVVNKRKMKCQIPSAGIVDRVSGLSCHCSNHWATSSFCIPLYMPHTKQIVFCFFFSYGKQVVFSYGIKCVLCIFVLYCSWHTSTSVEEVCFIFAWVWEFKSNASALYIHEYGDSNSILKKHKQLQMTALWNEN